MDKIIVYIDDAAHALQQLTPMKTGGPVASSLAQARQPIQVTQWILVACPPRMTQHINKWVNHSAREKWRAKWSEKVFAQIAPTLTTQGDLVVPLVAKGTLALPACWMPDVPGWARICPPSRATNPPSTTVAGVCRVPWPVWVRCWCWHQTKLQGIAPGSQG